MSAPTTSDPDPSDAAILRAYAPACLREPYLRAVGARGLPTQRPAWAFGFVEHVIRYLLAMLAPEGAAALGDEADDLWCRDRQKLSDGRMFQLAALMAKAVQLQPEAIARPAAEFLVDGRGRRTEAAKAIDRLLAARNEVAHGDTGPSSADSGTIARFEEAWVHDLRLVSQRLAFVRTCPIYALDSYDPQQPKGRLLCFSGAEPWRISLPAVPEGVPVCEPLLIAADGRWISVGPILGLGAISGGMVPRLLDIGRRRHQFTDPHGEGRVMPSPAWSARWVDGERLRAPATRGAPVPMLAQAVGRPDQRVPDLGAGYRAEALLERGSSAAVWLASDAVGRHYAAKVLHDPLRASELHRRRLHREVRLLTRCAHPGLVRTHGIIDDCPSAPVLLMDYVSGGDLGRAYARHRAPPAVATGLVLQVLDALAHLHARGGVHRDVKPANVLLSASGTAVVVDLGVARDADDARLTATLDNVGTQLYAAPEQLRGEPADGRADVYAVGRMLAWLVGGDLTLQRGDLNTLPAGMVAIVRRATRAEPHERYPSAQAMAEALREAAAAEWRSAPVSAGDVIAGVRVLSTPVSLGQALWTAEATGLAFKEPRRVWFAPVGHTDEHTLRTRLGPLPPGWNATEFEGLLVILAGPADQLPEAEAPRERPRPPPVTPATPATAPGSSRPPGPSLQRPPTAAESGQSAKDHQPAKAAEFSQPAAGADTWPSAWFDLLPALEAIDDSKVRTHLALESGLATLLAWTAIDGNASIKRWFGQRSSTAWRGAQAALKAVCLSHQGPRGQALERAWRRIDACVGERAQWVELRALIKRFAREQVAVPGPCVLVHGGLALVWDAHVRRGAVRLVDGVGVAIPSALQTRLGTEWLRSALQLEGIDHTRNRGEAVIGVRADHRNLAIAVRVADLAESPRNMPEVAVHLGWVQQNQVPLIALTDGERWRWLRREGQRELLEVVGDPAAWLAT